MKGVLSTHPADRRRAHRLRVRVLYGDTDKAQVVHHARYLDYLEAGGLEFLRHHGLNYRELESRTGLGMPVVEARLRYRAPARFDDLLDVETWVAACSRAKVVFESRILRGDEVLTEASITVTCVDMAAERIVSVPEEVRRACVG
ncbi:MAG: thioesterase family protein [Sandaracinaceae bacterium]